MKSIGFFGDSFCAGREPESWCVLLAEKLNANVVHWGEPGRSIWSTFFSYNRLINFDRLPDYSVFCYTEPYRLYHPNLILTANTERLPEVNPNIYDAMEDYFKYLHNYRKDEMAYSYSLQHFDKQVLKEASLKSKIIQMWSFKPFELAGPKPEIKLETGIFIDESMFQFSKTSQDSNDWKKQDLGHLMWGTGKINHMTPEQNQKWADKVYEAITS